MSLSFQLIILEMNLFIVTREQDIMTGNYLSTVLFLSIIEYAIYSNSYIHSKLFFSNFVPFFTLQSLLNTKSTMNKSIQPNNPPSHSKVISVRLFDFIDIHPSPVKHLFVSPHTNRIFISRQHYSEVYCYSSAQLPHQVTVNQLLRLQKCENLLQIDGVMVMVMPFQLRIHRNGFWSNYPFTTQLLSIWFDNKNGLLYTFHEKQSQEWRITEEDGVSMKYLQNQDTPYHVTLQGNLQGYGKKIVPPQKGTNFTTVQSSDTSHHIFVGSDSGTLYIYETNFLTNVKVITRHEAPILAITSHENACFFSGSDSKVSSLKWNEKNNQWVLGQQVRGQSHDITALVMSPDSKFLISAGYTTDLCFYEIDSSKQLESQMEKSWAHKVSYSCEEIIVSVGNYLIVNKYNSFEIWKSVDEQSKQNEFLVKYEFPFHKSIKKICAKFWEKKSDAVLIIVVTNYEAVTWIFNETEGLLKHSTISNVYDAIEFIEDSSSLITLREGFKLEKLDYKTGKIEELGQAFVDFVSSIKVQNTESNRTLILITSSFSRQANIYEYRRKSKQCELIKQIQMPNYFQFADFFGKNSLLVKNFGDYTLTELNWEDMTQTTVVDLPIRKIRYAGWFEKEIAQTKRRKLFWFGVGEGKLVIISNVSKKCEKKVKKVRVKQFPRIGTIIHNQGESAWDLAVVPLNFRKHIKEKVMAPVIVKKIQ